MAGVAAQIYRRAFSLTCAWPWLFLTPVLAELAQHVTELQVGMYSGSMDAAGRNLRLGFGAFKIAVIVSTLVITWRLWRHEGNMRRALRPTKRFFLGIATFLLVQFLGDLVAMGAGRMLAALADEAGRTARIMLMAGPLLVWLLISVLLIPWYVGLATEDGAMTLSRALRSARSQPFSVWGVFLVGSLPFMVVHYGLSYAAMRSPLMWPLLVVDAVVVGSLTVAMAATYYEIYRRAA